LPNTGKNSERKHIQFRKERKEKGRKREIVRFWEGTSYSERMKLITKERERERRGSGRAKLQNRKVKYNAKRRETEKERRKERQ
jgi:hypothetical protein